MDVQGLTRDKVREILRASEGIPSQVSDARKGDDGRLEAAKSGHAIGGHLHSASLAEDKTKFISFNDMVEALWLVLHSQEGVAKLRVLNTGHRATISVTLGRLFPFECELAGAQGRTHKVRFSTGEQVRAGWSQTACVAVVEARERANVQHLQVHTFYPKYARADLNRLLADIRATDEHRG